MPLAAMNAYLRDLPKHRAALQMMLVEAAGFPYLDENARRTRANAWEAAARGVSETGPTQYRLNPETQTFEEIPPK